MIKRLATLWTFRELLQNLVVRDLKVRYKNSILGFLWSLVNPLLLMAVFTVVFTIMLPNLSVPKFPVFVLCALLPWNFFNTSISGALASIAQGGYLIRKVYFPREVLPFSVVLANFVNLLLSFPALALLMVIFKVPFTIFILYLPFIILVQLAFTFGIALLLATLNVFYRDTGHIMEVLMQAWFFLTPVFYPLTLVPEWQTVFGLAIPVRRLAYILNPMASIIESYRSVLYGTVAGGPPGAPAMDFLARTAVTALIVFVIGYWVFGHYSSRFGEEV